MTDWKCRTLISFRVAARTEQSTGDQKALTETIERIHTHTPMDDIDDWLFRTMYKTLTIVHLFADPNKILKVRCERDNNWQNPNTHSVRRESTTATTHIRGYTLDKIYKKAPETHRIGRCTTTATTGSSDANNVKERSDIISCRYSNGQRNWIGVCVCIWRTDDNDMCTTRHQTIVDKYWPLRWFWLESHTTSGIAIQCAYSRRSRVRCRYYWVDIQKKHTRLSFMYLAEHTHAISIHMDSGQWWRNGRSAGV